MKSKQEILRSLVHRMDGIIAEGHTICEIIAIPEVADAIDLWELPLFHRGQRFDVRIVR